MESRILVAVHSYLEEVHRFKSLAENKDELLDLARHLVFEYYANKCDPAAQDLILDKEPLEPIAFPDRNYKAFLKNLRILFPEIKFLFMVRCPVATVFSMSQRKWGISLTNSERQTFSILEHVENWCACIDCILEYISDSNTYVCQFERLMADSVDESKQILDFLKIPKGKPFQPRQTKSIGFNQEEREFVLEKSRLKLEALDAHGIVFQQ
jgi:hypothetical protein